ncbi:S8 family peptidase [Psychrosphaera algicola]|uniref:S8 family serine peptidase n=1 Tax=Psychrosphaera algicola TaxID=3023714 RepID=A0ABT5FAJ7_9GAMM|nr:S8 family serine peptidase [Psychrosphaera sp. G1-22]MDC2888563.1 S8 family serine peptidase [Psychrosphaera sp. G1-22]
MTVSTLTHAKPVNFIYDVSGKFSQSKAEKQVSKAGGTLKSCIPEIGVCQVAFDSVDSAQNSGLTIVPDASVFIPKVQGMPEVANLTVSESDYGQPPASGDDDFFFDLQWGHNAVGAVDSWNAGHRGAGVRVAVIDSGADGGHPDLAPNINFDLSMSFVDGEAWYDAGPDVSNHGSHTAGTIAAADNGFGTIGVAPEAELVILKSLSAYTGSGSSYATMAAIVYAANIGADVVNMSLGMDVRHNGYFDVEGTPYDTSDDIKFTVGGKDGIAQFINTYAKAATYARQNGVLLIASAGNESTDMDKTDSLVKLPAGLPAVMSISALGPRLWANDPNTYTDHLAIYSNYGQSEIDFGAPIAAIT